MGRKESSQTKRPDSIEKFERLKPIGCDLSSAAEPANLSAWSSRKLPEWALTLNNETDKDLVVIRYFRSNHNGAKGCFKK